MAFAWILFAIAAALLFLAAIGVTSKRVNFVYLAACCFVLAFGVVSGRCC